MERFSAIVTGMSALILLLFAYALAPWSGNLIGGADFFGLPVWVMCFALALGLVAVSFHNFRSLFRGDRTRPGAA